MARVKWRDGYLTDAEQVRAIMGRTDPSRQVRWAELDGWCAGVLFLLGTWAWVVLNEAAEQVSSGWADTKDAAMRAAEEFARANSKPIEGEARG